MSTLVAGIDSSTQSTKVELRSLDDGRLRASAAAPHPTVLPPRSEQDPEAWWSALRSSLERALDLARRDGPVEVAAMAVAGQQHGMVALDTAGRPVHPAKLWNDTESAEDSERLIAELGGAEAWADAVGSVPLPAFTITKLSWLRRTHPDAFARMRHVMLPHDYLTARLTGRVGDAAIEPTTDRGDASGTGYWSPAEGRYRTDVLELVDGSTGWEERLPHVLGPLEEAGRHGDTVVAAGTGDNMAAALGVGLGDGEAVISIGTSGTAYRRSTRPSADASGAVAGFADAAGHYLPLVCNSNAARIFDTVAAWLAVDHEELDGLASGGRRDVPTLVPYFDGERTPNRPTARGLLAGLHTATSREDLARAAVDGVAFGLIDALEALQSVTPPASTILLTGGGSRSAALTSTIAALVDVPVFVVDVDQAVATGAAIQAATALEGCASDEIESRWSVARRHLVDPADDAELAERRRRYVEIRDDSSVLDGMFEA